MEIFTRVQECSCILLLSWIVQSCESEISRGNITETFTEIVSISDMASVVIYSDSDEALARNVDEILDRHAVKRKAVDNLTSMETITEHEINKATGCSNVGEMTSKLNFIVLCNGTCVRNLLETVRKIDFQYRMDIIMRHYSRWIIVPSNGENTEFENLLFDNSIVLSFKQEKSVVETMVLESGRKYLQKLSYVQAEQVFPNIKYGMKEIQLTVAAMQWTPYTIERYLEDDTLSFDGISRDVLKGLASTFNFTYKFVMPCDKAWGSQDENGNWNGIIAMLQKKEADLCISPYAWNPDRAKVIEFGYPFSYDEFVAIYKKSKQKNKWTFITTSFKLEVYLYWLLSLIVVIASFLMFETLNVKNRQRKTWLTVVGITIYAVRIPLQQASPSFPASRSSRVLLCFWWLLSIVMASVYTGNLMASLAVSVNDVPFNTLQELAADREYAIGVFRDTQMEVFLKTSKVKTFQEIWRKILKFRQSESSIASGDGLKHHMNLLSSGGYVFLTTRNIAEEIMSVECDVKIMKDVLSPGKAGFIFPLGFPLARMFSEKMRTMADTGLIDLWVKNWTPKKKICSLPAYIDAHSIDVDVMFGAIIVALVGIGTALSVLSLELGYTKFYKSINN